MIAARPDIIVGSWCGKKFVPAKVAARPGFAEVPAVANGWLREIKSTLILQPGPAALTDGLDRLAAIVADWAEGSGKAWHASPASPVGNPASRAMNTEITKQDLPR